MTIKIEFAGGQPSRREVKTYTGNVKDWPEGVYRLGSGHVYISVCRGSVLTVCKDGRVDNPNHSWHSPFTRISDDPRIASITFAGTMNYPDGKPDGVDEPDPIKAACEEIRRVCDEQFAKSQLSDPTDLKVGDWIQWMRGYGDFTNFGNRSNIEITQVTGVDKDRFSTLGVSGEWAMGIGRGYTVVPAPKESTSAD